MTRVLEIAERFQSEEVAHNCAREFGEDSKCTHTMKPKTHPSKADEYNSPLGHRVKPR